MDNQPFIQFLFNLENVRIYYQKEESPPLFFLVHSDLKGITPFAHKQVIRIHNILAGLFKNKINIEMEFFYPNNIPKKYKKEINSLTGDITDENMSKVILKMLLVLMKI